MSTALQLGRAVGIATASAVVSASPGAAQEIARTPTITGQAWVALVIIGIFVMTIFLLIAGVLHVERRDARLGRGRSRDDSGWFGLFPYDSDDDHHHGGGDGGEVG